MKSSLTIFFATLLLFSCGTDNAGQGELSMDWIVGSWERDNEVEGKQTTEYWEKESAEVYVGYGLTLRDIDTIFYEKMKIHQLNKAWVLEVAGPNESPTIFKFTNQDALSFKTSCPENEFPKTISYQLEGDKLKATVADDRDKIDFLFSRLEKIN